MATGVTDGVLQVLELVGVFASFQALLRGFLNSLKLFQELFWPVSVIDGCYYEELWAA